MANLTEQQKKEFAQKLKELYQDYNEMHDRQENELNGLQEKANSLPEKVSSFDEEFEKLTSLTPKDDAFLVFATLLQMLRSYLINKLKERVDDKEAAKNTPGHNDNEHSNRTGKYYASIDEMLSNPVPFDCIQKEVEIKESEYNPKLNGFNHRYKAIGHDPFFGLIFGTANIMTNTITVTEGKFVLSSYHVHTGESLRTYNGIPKTIQLDKIYERASTVEIFSSIVKRITEEGTDGWKALGTALLKEVIHLVSDIRTEKSLPLPFLSMINPNISRYLNFVGIDQWSVKMFKQEATFSMFINFIISKIHEWCYNEDKDGSKELYMVRNMKIIQISNELATGVSCLKAAVQMYMGEPSALRNFDFGGAFVTLFNTWNTPLKIAELKHEYILNNTIKYIKQ